MPVWVAEVHRPGLVIYGAWRVDEFHAARPQLVERRFDARHAEDDLRSGPALGRTSSQLPAECEGYSVAIEEREVFKSDSERKPKPVAIELTERSRPALASMTNLNPWISTMVPSFRGNSSK